MQVPCHPDMPIYGSAKWSTPPLTSAVKVHYTVKQHVGACAMLVGYGECLWVWDGNLLLQGHQEVAQFGLEDLHALQGNGLWP